jgi:hypothetical protein
MEIIDQSLVPLKKLKLSGLNLNHVSLVSYIYNQFYSNPGLLELDLSHSKLFPKDFANIMEHLANEFDNPPNMKLATLNVSYISTNGYTEKISENLATIIEKSIFLMHLDISGLNLNNDIKPIIKAVKSNTILISIHLNDNSLSTSVREFVMRTMIVET